MLAFGRLPCKLILVGALFLPGGWVRTRDGQVETILAPFD
jgi:hypothetical protein